MVQAGEDAHIPSGGGELPFVGGKGLADAHLHVVPGRAVVDPVCRAGKSQQRKTRRQRHLGVVEALKRLIQGDELPGLRLRRLDREGVPVARFNLAEVNPGGTNLDVGRLAEGGRLAAIRCADRVTESMLL